MKKKYLLGFILLILLYSFVYSAPIPPVGDCLSQDATQYATTSQPLVSSFQQTQDAQAFLTKYFSVWNTPYTCSMGYLNSSYAQFIMHPGYGENLLPLSSEYFVNLASESDPTTFGEVSLPAVVVANSNMRVFPTNAPEYSYVSSTPFDNLQTTSIYYGTPVDVVGETLDKNWDYVVSSMGASGWLPASSIAYVSENQIHAAENTNSYMVVTQDNASIVNSVGCSIAAGYVGMIFPVVGQANGNWQILGFGKNFSDSRAQSITLNIQPSQGSKFPIALTEGNVAKIINQLQGEPYGWAGSYFYRDCSATQKDIFAEFGIFLTRNSSSMTSCGQSISLQNMSNSDKLALIQSEAIPFRTLLIMSGHVMLYLGDSNSQAIMFQQFWGGSFINTGSSISFISKEAEITYVDMSIQGEGSATLTALTNMVIIGGSGQNTEGNTISSNTSNLNISGGSVVNITTSSVKSDQIDNASMIKTPNFVEASAPLHINKSVIKKICDINLRSVLFYSMVPYKNSINAVSMKTQSTLLLSSN